MTDNKLKLSIKIVRAIIIHYHQQRFISSLCGDAMCDRLMAETEAAVFTLMAVNFKCN